MELNSNPAMECEVTNPEISEDAQDDGSDLIEADLREDLQRSLNFAQAGSFEHSTLLPFMPHPALSIGDINAVPISLPLSEGDAKTIISRASRAPYGHGNQTIVNREVRDTWEIDPKHVKLKNSAWTDYVKELAIQVCTGLGVANYSTPPRADFYKLLLYETGSHFLPHKDTPKADGMFATMIILLPSKYTGGEVHLTHTSTSKVIDFAQSSQWSSAVLAWYTDVLHEVKTITSGYRLALSYNLIDTSPQIPKPMAPESESMIIRLRKVLKHWKAGKYDCEYKDGNYIVHLLKHQYSAAELRRGVACLKGEDSHRVSTMRHVAEELDYMICLANVECHIEGDADDGDGDGRSQRHRKSGVPSIVEEYGRTISLKGTVDLDGHPLPPDWLYVSAEHLIPENVFKDEEPDDFVCGGYTGNEGAPVEYWYHRSAFMLLPRQEYPNVILKKCSAKFLMTKFQGSLTQASPTSSDEELAAIIIEKLRDQLPLIRIIMNYALEWKNVDMWKQIMRSTGTHVDLGEYRITSAWQVFGFDAIQQSLEEWLAQKNVRSWLKCVEEISQNAPRCDEANIKQWCSGQADTALASYTSFVDEDIPFFVSMACREGIQRLRALPISKTEVPTFRFLKSLVPAINEKRNEILLQTSVHCGNDSVQATSILAEFIDRCFEAAIASNTSFGELDAPFFVSMACQVGIQRLDALPKSRGSNFKFLARLAPALLEKSNEILLQTSVHCDKDDPAQAQNQAALIFDRFIQLCLDAAVSSYTRFDETDVPFFVSTSSQRGIQALRNLRISKGSDFKFLITLVQSLYETRNEILLQTSARCGNNEAQASTILNEFIEGCLETAVKKWNQVIYHSSEPKSTPLERILEVVQLCILTDQMNPCNSLFKLIWNAPGDVATNLDILFLPLGYKLVTYLQKSNRHICSPPFSDFFRSLIAACLHHKIRELLPNPMPQLRKLGCGCSDCYLLNSFLESSQKDFVFTADQGSRNHIINRIRKASDLVTYETSRSGLPHTLVITKTSAMQAAIAVKNIQGLIGVIGDTNLQKIMGTRYPDVASTLRGESVFELDQSTRFGARTTAGSSPNESIPSVAGEKRKQGS